MRKRPFWVIALLCLAIALSCQVPGLRPTPTPTPTPTATPTRTPLPTWTPPPTPRPTSTPEPADTGWRRVREGVEARALDVPQPNGVERVTLVRLDPAVVRFHVRYAPGEPQPVSAWAALPGALLTVNAGYFTAEYLATGLLISDGERHGASYEDYAGMFAVREDGAVSVRWLRNRPFDPQEPLRQAVQCFPVLVKPGGVMGFPADADDGRPARRTVVAQDRSGRVLVLVAPRGYFSLHRLAVWLVSADLDVDIALNLDGGPSSGLWLHDGPRIDSLSPVPAVIVVTAD